MCRKRVYLEVFDWSWRPVDRMLRHISPDTVQLSDNTWVYIYM